MTESSARSVAKGISILGITGIICKLVGVLFSIPLNMISIEGQSVADIFYLVYPTYTLLLTISSAGLPVAVSRMVSGFLANHDPRNGKNTFKVALASLFLIGLAFSLILTVANRTLTQMVSRQDTSLGFYAIAPCVMIVCILSAFRGFIQGQQNMLPTAISQLIEQVGKVFLSLPLAYIGVHVYHDLGLAAAGALLGITVSEVIALVYIIVYYCRKRKSFDLLPQKEDEFLCSNHYLLKRLVLISVPITISACIIPFSQFIDSAMMIKRMMVAGIDEQLAGSYYGAFTSIFIRLINIPTALALAISMSLVPAVSARRAVNDYDGVRRESNTGMRYAFLIGFPCSVGMSMLSREIIYFIYGFALPEWKIQLASELLTFSALTIVLFTVVQATSSILQGLRKQMIPMLTMIAGVAVKIVLNYFLIGTPGIDIHGGPFASIACYSVVMVVNLIYVCKYGKMKLNWIDWIIRPGLSAAVMGLIVFAMKSFFPAGRIWTVIEVLVGILSFLISAFIFKAVSKDDIYAIIRRRKK